MRRGHVVVVGTLLIVAVTVGAVTYLARGGSSAPIAGTITRPTAGASGGDCIVYPYSGAPYSGLSIIATLCSPGLGLGSGPIKLVDGYCIEDTKENWHEVTSADGDIRLVKGPCPG